jgi:16S rRNA A1518/A1519 N6-dimethyltransferase RsmA/KsgA/DIM1 with predicted DNA glycosylase/AP lyase activity
MTAGRVRRRRRRSLGQHYLVDSSVVARIIGLASIRRSDRVLEIGTGRGALTRELVSLTDRLEGYEVDGETYAELERELGATPSLTLHNEDAFESSPSFDVLLSSLPYSESSVFIEWLSHQRYQRAVVVLQQDFARKITAPPGDGAYRAVSVISQASARVEIVSGIGRQSFDPPPRVNSSLVAMRWKRSLTVEQTALIKRVFSQKRRTLGAALKRLDLVLPPTSRLSAGSRVNKLEPESVMALVRGLGA